MKTKTMKRRKGNLRYVMKNVGAADKGLVWFALVKNSMEQIFYVEPVSFCLYTAALCHGVLPAVQSKELLMKQFFLIL